MTYALSIQHLEKSYQNGFQALKGISLQVDQGDFFALLGPNGAGKTTLIGIISSLVIKTAGSVKILGKDMDAYPQLVKSYLGIVPQEFNFVEFDRVEQVLLMQAGYYGLPMKLAKERTEKYLRRLELWDKRDQKVRFLSGGMKRRLMIARALVHEPKILILDEPTAGVDIEIRRMMWQFLRDINAQGITIVLTTHYLEEAESLCRNIAIINSGEIITHMKMSTLLSQLHVETIVLYLQSPVQTLPQLPGYLCRLTDDITMEVDLNESQNLNDLFVLLSHHGITVARMKNKTNRLEQLFVQLTSSGEDIT